jgi:hypothetical protein
VAPLQGVATQTRTIAFLREDRVDRGGNHSALLLYDGVRCAFAARVTEEGKTSR